MAALIAVKREGERLENRLIGDDLARHGARAQHTLEETFGGGFVAPLLQQGNASSGPSAGVTRGAIGHSLILAVFADENVMFSSPRTAVVLDVAALGLVCSPSYAEQTIKAALLMNSIQLNASGVKTGKKRKCGA